MRSLNLVSVPDLPFRRVLLMNTARTAGAGAAQGKGPSLKCGYCVKTYKNQRHEEPVYGFINILKHPDKVKICSFYKVSF